jgi:hypothetical protein
VLHCHLSLLSPGLLLLAAGSALHVASLAVGCLPLLDALQAASSQQAFEPQMQLARSFKGAGV